MLRLAAVQKKSAERVIPYQRRALMSRVKGANFQGSPTARFTHEDTPLAGDPFEKDQPPGTPMVCQPMIVPGIGNEAVIELLPGIILKQPSVPKGSAAAVIFRPAMQKTSLEVRIVGERRIAPCRGGHAGNPLPGGSVKGPGVSQGLVVGVDSAKEYRNLGAFVEGQAMTGTRGWGCSA